MNKEQLANQVVEWMYAYMDYYNGQFVHKNSFTLAEINEHSNELLQKYFDKREMIRMEVANDKELFQRMYKQCEDNITTFTLFDSFVRDTNRNPKAKLQPMIPYKFQLPLFNSYYDERSTVVIKSRRMGASAIMNEHMKHQLIFVDNSTNFTTHKDLNSLDKAGDVSNTTFGKLRLSLKNSIFSNKLIFKNFDEDNRIENSRIVHRGNSLIGSVLSPSTSVGAACNIGFIDEIAVVEMLYRNASDYILGAIATSTNKLMLYSTFRGTQGKFYQIVEEKDEKYYNFITLDWKEHPLCNTEWYDKASALMNKDKVTIAQELDHNPYMSREGVIYSYITDKNKVDPKTMTNLINTGKKYIFSDFGGGTSHTVFLMCYSDGINLYMHDVIKTTNMDENQIKKEIQNKGFWGVPIHGDISGKNQTNAPNYSWFKLLSAVGFQVNAVPNYDMIQFYALTNMKFLEGFYKYNKNIKDLSDLEKAKWKTNTMEVEKNSHSHIADALAYGTRHLFRPPSFSSF